MNATARATIGPCARFRDEFKPAFDAWLATWGPKTPLELPQYRLFWLVTLPAQLST